MIDLAEATCNCWRSVRYSLIGFSKLKPYSNHCNEWK